MKPILDPQPVQPLPPTDPRYTEGGAESKVPDVVGRGQDDARSILEKAGFKVSTRTVDNRADKGTVVGQGPTAPPCPGRRSCSTVSSGDVPPPPPPPGGSADTGGGNGGNGGNP